VKNKRREQVRWRRSYATQHRVALARARKVRGHPLCHLLSAGDAVAY
jgi:hypothetical protein